MCATEQERSESAMRERGRGGPLLLIDTVGADGSLALASVGERPRVLRSVRLPGRSASERLFPELRALLAEEGCAIADLQAISVVRGPGSFTGARVGVAAAKGMAEALGVPVIGLSRLAVLAGAAWERVPEAEGREVVAVLRAGRGEVFAARFHEGEDVPLWERLLTGEEAVRTAEGALLVGAEDEVIDGMGAAEGTPLLRAGVIDAGSALAPAVRRLRASLFDDVALLDAHYLRRTPAELAALRHGAGERAR